MQKMLENGETDLLMPDSEEGIGTYRWTISDTGIGVSGEFLKHIFEAFTQEKKDARSVYQGTGLGMTIAKNLVEKMSGSIEITSEMGVGSAFVIMIPFEIAPPPKEPPERTLPEEETIWGRCLLLAEDNELNAEIAEMLLTDEGAEINMVHDGRAGNSPA